MKRAIVLATAAFLIAAPISFAQTNPPPKQTPPAATAPTTPAPSATEAAPPSSTPAPAATAPAAPSAPTPAAPAATTASSDAAPQGCRTRKAAGEPCACLSDTSRVGTSTAHPDGHNVCVRPD